MDDRIDSYEKFCRAFRNPAKEKRAKLILMIQDWIIRIIDKIDAESSDYNFDTLIIHNSDKQHLRYAKKDAVSRLVDDTFVAIRRISENMRENIIRENVKLPLYKVREINGYGLNWLSRRPGFTIKQKISSANNSMMAVQRRMSLDTGENRLYMAYLKELADLVQTKLEMFPSNQQRSEEAQFCLLIQSIIRNPEFEEIRRWENLPPNNTLISDQNYKKIWRGWNELKQLDELIGADDADIAQRLCAIFYVEFLTKASQYVRFPQIPATVTYEDYSVRLYSDCFLGIDDVGRVLKVQLGETGLIIKYADKCIDIHFEDTNIHFCIEGESESVFPLKGESLSKYVELALVKLGCKIRIKDVGIKESEVKKFQSVVMDIFALRPQYIGDNQDVAQLDGRILRQTHICRYDEEEHRFDVPCDQSDAILLGSKVETYTVPISVENASGLQMSKLMHLLERYVSSQKFAFLFPDIYNEFQLSLVHKAARLVFHEVRAFPRSIGAAFSYLKMPAFQKVFNIGDFLLVLDLVDNDVSMTLVQGVREEAVEQIMPEFGGVVWERHPSTSSSIDKEIDDLTDSLLAHGSANKFATYNILGLDGFDSERNRLTIIYNEQEHLHLNDHLIREIKSTKINITNIIDVFLIGHKSILGNHHVHIISLSEQLFYKGENNFVFMNRRVVLEGYRIYEELQKKVETVLWRDHLPELSIKLLYGKFNLVDQETVTPEFNVKKKIVIKNTFTLSKGIAVYHFHLVQNDTNRNTRYEAIVKNPAFPLAHDVECYLDMTYQYGAEEPYRLFFIPKKKDAGFVEAKVTWAKITEYPCDDMDSPEPIHSVKWSELRAYPGRNGIENHIEGLQYRFNTIQKGYQTIDLTKYEVYPKGVMGKRSFTIKTIINGELANLVFLEKNMDKNQKGVRWNFNRLGFVSYTPSKTQDNPRYTTILSNDDYRGIWIKNEFGYTCIRTICIEGVNKKVAFYKSSFVNPEDFSPNVRKISFELISNNGKFKAINIHNEELGIPYNRIKTYMALDIRVGNKPSQFLYNGWFYVIMLTVFIGKNSLHDDDCPIALKQAFHDSKDSWINMFKECSDDYVKMRIFNLMSLVAEDIGPIYYDIATNYIDNYIVGKSKLPDYIGYALGDCTTKSQKLLLERIYKLEDKRAVCLLSKSIWGNEDFIWNIPISKSLHYFYAAVIYLNELCQNNYNNSKDITLCLEYILGVFRLREYRDHDLNYQLSLNSKAGQMVYQVIEGIIENQKGDEVRSELKLEVPNKGIYEDIPNLLYAILLYITGEKGAGDIRITGLDLNTI